jgi:hypothetical protein
MLPGTFKKGGSIIPVHERHGGSVLLRAKINLKKGTPANNCSDITTSNAGREVEEPD